MSVYSFNGQLMFQNIVTGEIEEFKGVKDFTPYKVEAPYDIHAASNVCIDILKAVMGLRHAAFYNTVTEIILKHGFRHRDPEQHGKWTYNFTYSFKRNGNQKDILYTIIIIFNGDRTISDIIIDENLLPGFDTAVKDTIYVNFVTRYNYCRAQEEPKSFNLKSLHKKFMADTAIGKVPKVTYRDGTDTVIARVTNYSKEKFMNRDEFKRKVRVTIYDAVRKYVIEDIFDLHKDSYVRFEDYLDEVNERFKCKKVDINWHDVPTTKDVMDYYGVFSVLFNGKDAPMYFVVKCTIDQSNTTDIFNNLVVTLKDGERRNAHEYHSQMLEKKIRNAVEAVIPHTYIEPKMAWPTVNLNITQLWAYDLIAKIAKEYEEEKKMTVGKTMTLEKANDIYSKFDSEQREAIKVLCSNAEKNLLRELGDLKKELDIRKRGCEQMIKDRENMKYLLNSAYGVAMVQHNKFEIKEITINEPAMIVFWKDGTKTVVKAQEGEAFDEEKGLAMAYAKKALGNNYAAGGRFKQRLKHAKRVNKEREETDISKIPICKEIMQEAMRRVKAEMEADAAKEPTEKPAAKKSATRKTKN